MHSEDHVKVMGLNAAGAALNNEIEYSDGSLTMAVWLTHRLLWALPWTALALHVPSSTIAARALGQIFDSTVLCRHAVRPMAWLMRGSAGRSGGPASSEMS
jgi:hypothetical protein